MRTIRQLGPLAIVVTLVSALTWYLLDHDDAAGEWLLAALLLAHGLLHLSFLAPMPARASAAGHAMDWPFDLGDSWLIRTTGIQRGLVRAMGIALIAIVCSCSVLAALATVGILVPAAWWTALVVGAAAGSFVLLALVSAPALLIGFAIDIALLWLALWSGWSPVD